MSKSYNNIMLEHPAIEIRRIIHLIIQNRFVKIARILFQDSNGIV